MRREWKWAAVFFRLRKRSSVALGLLAMLLAMSSLSCERDDLCAPGEALTPRIRITFQNVDSPTILKNVPNLEVRATTDTGTEVILQDANASDILLPLPVQGSEITLQFARDTDDTTTTENADDVIMTFQLEQQYINRACGFRVLYNNLNAIAPGDTDSWIQNIIIVEDDVTNEEDIHVQIQH